MSKTIGFHRTRAGRIGAHVFDPGTGRRNGWDTQRSFETLEEAVEGTHIPAGHSVDPQLSDEWEAWLRLSTLLGRMIR